jgi:2-polyprenyl-3-methyl-5-hydroxy-6-metoxy-1,4-benzoquinol methylase
MDTIARHASKYTPEAAANYQIRKPGKHRAEMALVRRAFTTVPRGTVLDVPCGGGRVSLLLSELGHDVTAADLSSGMVEIARAAVNAAGAHVRVEQRNLESLDFNPQSFDSVICFRLFHHFATTDLRARAVAELCRVARRRVLLSYFSPYSSTALKRTLQARLFRRPTKKFHTPLSEVARYFESNHFRFVRDFARTPLIHTLHLAVFEREA